MNGNSWTAMWGPYAPAMEAWQAFVMNSMTEFGRASMAWMTMPLTVGRSLQAANDGSGVQQLQDLLRQAASVHAQAEALANSAYATSLDAGCRSFREFEAAALDRGTFSLTIRRAA